MAIHDTQPGDQRRGNPMPTNHDVRTRRHADSTQSITNKIDEDSGARVVTKDGQIIVYDVNDKASIVIGLVPEYSSEPLFIVAKSGYDVFTDILEI